MQEDIRGSVGGYYPYGEDRSSTANDVIKFASYVRDSTSGLDYAVNRYHVPGNGRFASPDPYNASGGPGDPGSWNRYAYASGDPVDGEDPFGQATCDVNSYVAGGEGHGALYVFANCSTVYADMSWAEIYGSTIQSYAAIFPTGSGMTTQEATSIAIRYETGYEAGIFNLYLRSQAKDSVSVISNDCNSVLQAGGISPSALANSALSDYFYDGAQPYNASQMATDWGLLFPGKTVAWVLANIDNAFVNGFTYRDVMLGSQALPWSSDFQPLILVHELLHTFTLLSDTGLAQRLGCSLVSSDCANGVNASLFITIELRTGCHDLWAAIQKNGGIPR